MKNTNADCKHFLHRSVMIAVGAYSKKMWNRPHLPNGQSLKKEHEKKHMSSRVKETIRRNLFGIITITVSAIVLVAFLFFSDSIRSIQNLPDGLNWNWMLLGIFFAATTWLLEGFSLNLICKVVYPQWKFHYSFCMGMVGMLYSALTPCSTGGQPMQIYSMHRLGMDTGAAGSIIAIKTIVYQIIMVLYALTMVVFRLSFFQRNVSDFSFLTILGLVCNSTFIALVLLFCISQKITNKLLHKGIFLLHKLHLCRKPDERYEKIRSQLSIFHGSTRLIGRSFGMYAGVCIATIIQIGLGYMIPYCIYRGFGFHAVDLLTIMAAQAYVSMVSAFVPLPGASGGAEGSFMIFFKIFFPGGTVIPAMVIWRALTYYINLPVGSICSYISNRLKPLKLPSKKGATVEEIINGYMPADEGIPSEEI